MKRAALFILLALAACGGREVEDTGLSLVARREGDDGYLVWGRTTSPEALELSMEDGERVLFGPVPLLAREGRFRVDFTVEPTERPVLFLFLSDARGERQWRVEIPRGRREVRFGPPLPPEPPAPEYLPMSK
ncbi:MAG TPA: hypothetical protein VF710_05755 [Longimicrobium sp.]